MAEYFNRLLEKKRSEMQKKGNSICALLIVTVRCTYVELISDMS